jgi:hypothetical protein
MTQGTVKVRRCVMVAGLAMMVLAVAAVLMVAIAHTSRGGSGGSEDRTV